MNPQRITFHTRYRAIPLFVFLFTLAIIFGCAKKGSSDAASLDAVFNPYLSAYTSGEISRTSPVEVRFSREMVPPERVGQALAGGLFTLDPGVKGAATWQNTRTLVFSPEGPLPSGKEYEYRIDLKEIRDSLPEMPDVFVHRFRTMPQGVNVSLAGMQTIDLKNFKWQQISGQLRTRDFENSEVIEKIFSARFNQQRLPVKWEHNEEEYTHTFVIDSVPRTAQSEEVLLAWNGQAADLPVSGETRVSIPALGDFSLTDVATFNHPEQYMLLTFSDPLQANQNLQGLVRLGDQRLRYMIDGNQVKVFPSGMLEGAQTLVVEKGIKNMAGKPIPKAYREEITFDMPKPEVRLVGNGVILPRSQSLPFTFETLGLKAVDVRVIRIQENNVHQFLQVNQLNGRDELKRVGQVIAREKITFEDQLNLSSWTRHSLDLSKLINPAPGAIYEVALGFQPGDILYGCETIEGGGEGEPEVDMLAVSERWNEPGWGEYDYYYYDWEERDNPCHRAYYNNNRVVQRNVLSSDLGLIAKSGPKGTQITVTDIHTTNPMEGVALTVYDYQQQIIATATTNADGHAFPELDRKPFLLVAQSGEQRGYLRVDDGSSLSISRFAVDGATYQEGLKGFIYGERGVWRPGDDIHLTFMLEDQEQKLPANHPVVFELTDPRGQRVHREVRTEGLNGFYVFPVSTQPDAPTGNYAARVKVGGATFYKNVKVETILPNRLNIDLRFDREALIAGTDATNGTLRVNWLHGAPGSNLKAEVIATLSRKSTRFDTYQDFNFDDPVRLFDSEEFTVFEGQLSASGEARIPATISTDYAAPGMLNALFRTRAFEPGGGFSTDVMRIDYHPYPVYVGVKAPETDSWRQVLPTGEDQTLEIVTLDPAGRPVNRNNLKLTLYKLDWRWWWDRSHDDISNYQGKVYSDPVQRATLRTVEGKASWTFNIAEEDWGRYLVRIEDPSGHITGQVIYLDWPGWAGRTRGGANEGASMLNFTADKDRYKVGEQVTLNIPTGYDGRALVSIERGTEVIASHWVNARQGMTTFSFEATEAMTPNVYAHVTLLQPHAQTRNDLPIRMYGVIPITVEDPRTFLRPVITMDKEIEPNSTFEVRVSEAEGAPMTYTLAVVDEGLLNLTRFNTPDPHEAFFQKEALMVKTWDVFDEVVGAYGGEIKSLLSIGGGMEEGAVEENSQNRFKPVVKFLGPFFLEKGKSQTHTLDMPNYVGAVRTMVIAGQEGAYGFAEQQTPVKKDLMVLGTLPRVLGPGETLRLPVTVFAMEDRIKQVQVSVETNEALKLNGNGRQTLTFDRPGDQVSGFEMEVQALPGQGHVRIVARSGNTQAEYETDIEIRIPNPPVTEVFAQRLEAGQSWTHNYQPLGIEGTNAFTLEVSAVPPLNLGRRLKYLIRYPYGCLEQTISSVFPQLYLASLMDLSDTQKREIQGNLQAALKRLQRFQLRDGGFSYWPGARSASVWSSNYAGHFLLEAQNMGFRLPDGMLDNWLAYQQSTANSWSVQRTDWSYQPHVLTQAYRLFLLSLAGKPEIGAMNRLRQESNMYIGAQWYLAAAYHLAGQRKIASKIADKLDLNVPDYQEMSYTYGSRVRDQAIILQALSVMDRKEQAATLVDQISGQLSDERWMSTQSTAYSLIAMADYIGRTRTGDDRLAFSYQLGKSNPTSVSSRHVLWQLTPETVQAQPVTFTNSGQQALFLRVVSEGIPLQGDTRTIEQGLALAISYQTPNGQSVDPARLPQGQEFIASVTVSNTGNRNYQELALNQIFPSGWEIFNTRLYDEAQAGDRPTYQDLRDDRVYTFFDLPRGKSKTFKVRLSASYPGKYYLASTAVEAMYDHSVHARKGGGWVEVVSPSSGD